MFLDHDDLDADEVHMRGDDLVGSQSAQQASSSRARMLAQQRELQQRKKQQSLSAAGNVTLGRTGTCLPCAVACSRDSCVVIVLADAAMIRANDAIGGEGGVAQHTPAVPQFSRPRSVKDRSAE